MVLYKHLFMRQSQPIAVVLMLVCSQADHFHVEDGEEIQQFLDQMLIRIEMEWIVLGLEKKVRPEWKERV